MQDNIEKIEERAREFSGLCKNCENKNTIYTKDRCSPCIMHARYYGYVQGAKEQLEIDDKLPKPQLTNYIVDKNNIMIGDWFYVEGHLGNIQVDDIIRDSICTKDDKFESEEVKITDLKPIPLTEVILLNNGFSRDNICSLKITYKMTNIKIDVFDFNDNQYRVIINGQDYLVSYLHQLQHVFRIFGIEWKFKLS